jgi:hypothetical protein
LRLGSIINQPALDLSLPVWSPGWYVIAARTVVGTELLAQFLGASVVRFDVDRALEEKRFVEAV